MQPCEAVVRSNGTRQLCSCPNYTGELPASSESACLSCGHCFAKHVNEIPSGPSVGQPSANFSPTQALASTATTSTDLPVAANPPPVGTQVAQVNLATLLEQRLQGAGALSNKILTASKEANAGLRSSRGGTTGGKGYVLISFMPGYPYQHE